MDNPQDAPWLNDPIASAQDAPWLNDPEVSQASPDTEANKGVAEKAFDALRYGAQQDASGISKTLGGPQAPLGASDYTPASQGLHDTSKGYLDRASYLPRAILEGAPQGVQHALAGAASGALGGAMGGPVGATLGGLAGAAGSYGLSNYSQDLEDASKAAGEDPNAPSTWTKAKVIASQLAGGALSRLGLTSGLGTAEKAIGAEAIPAVASAITKSAAENAALASAQTIQHSGLINGQLPTVDSVATDALTGGAIGAGLRTLKAPGELSQAYKFSDFGPEFAPVADRFDGKDTSTPATSFKAVKSVERDLQNEIKTQSDTAAHISSLEKQPGYDADVRQQLDAVRGKLRAGEVVDPEDISGIKDQLGGFRQGADLVTSLTDYNNLNRMKEIGNFNPGTKSFAGGIAEAPGAKDILTPHLGIIPVGGGAIATHMLLGIGGLGHIGAGVLGIPALQYVLRSATRGVDSLLGNRNPLPEFTSRLSDTGSSNYHPDTSQLPNYRDVFAQKQQELAAAKKVSKEQSSSDNSSALAAQRAQKVAEANQAKADTKAQREKEDAAKWLYEIRQRHTQAMIVDSGLKQNSNGPSMDATGAIRHARFMAKLEKQAAARGAPRSQAAPESQATIRSAPELGPGPARTAGPSVDPATFSVTRGEQTVTRPLEGTRNQPAVASKIGAALEARAAAVSAAHKALAFADAPAKDHEVLDELHSQLNHGSGMGSKSAARAEIDSAIHRISPAHRALAKAALRRHHLLAFHKDQ